MFWNKEIETMDRAALERLQLELLNATLKRAGQAPHYRALFGTGGAPAAKSLAELTHMPFTTKADLRDGFPYGFLA
ncbi:MAG: phenylacetate--CoA ligase, partial [Spirochaetes bacterium]|nr:phenylacetate--CoA ligase [Spirochaetota bacterium]